MGDEIRISLDGNNYITFTNYDIKRVNGCYQMDKIKLKRL